MLSAFDLIAILLVLTAAFGWVSHRIIQLPHTIGLLVMGLGASLSHIGVRFPTVLFYEDLLELSGKSTSRRPFSTACFVPPLREPSTSIWPFCGSERDRSSMATIGILISTAIVSIGFWLASQALGVPVPFEWHWCSVR